MDKNEIVSLKRQQILDGVKHHADSNWLREHCITTYGLVDNDVRRVVWPILAGVNGESYCTYEADALKSNSNYHQVQLDVNRLDSLMPSGLSTEEKDEIRETMMRLVVSVLMDNPSMHYYQGFHDICYVFLSVLGEDGARLALNKLLPSRFSLFMEKTMEGTVDYMQLIFAMLGHLRPQLTKNMEAVGLGPHFALAWIVTWFAHVLPEMDDVRRLFDLFLATDSLMLIYLSVAVIIRSDEEVQSTAADFGLLHHTLLRLPKKHPVEELVRYSVKLFIAVPPERLLELGEQRHAVLTANLNAMKKPLPSRHSERPIRLYVGALVVAALAYLVYWWRLH